jgi:uncharacterized DUF497 family protein
MRFEFDQEKSSSNKKKHGIDFDTARQLRNDTNRIVIPARWVDEPRYVLIARLDKNIWSVIFTRRSSGIRIISVRKSRDNEKEIYYSSGI